LTRIPPPLLGYNNNVRYLGRTFHIQTEDSGTKYARIMTHLFIDGGRIVKTTRTEYGAVLEQPNMAETLRRMMKEQHKNMFLSLRAGEFDDIIERALIGDAPASSLEPALSRVPRLRADSLPSLSFGAGDEAKTMPGMSTLVIDSTLTPPPKPETSLVHDAVASQPVAERDASVASAEADENSAHQSGAASKRPNSRPRKSGSPAAPRRQNLDSEPAPVDRPGPGVAAGADRPSERSSRQIPLRPPTFTQGAIDPRSQSIFGDATAGRQSLDEVILSFLEDEET